MKEALLDKGRQWLRRGDFVQALTEMDRFFSFYRKAPEGWYIRAAALTNLKRHREARRDLGTFLVYSWGVPQAHQKAGICLLAMEDVDGAAGQFKEAVAKDPLTGDSLLFLLVLEQMRGNFKDALKGLRLARAAGYPPALVYYLEGQTYLALQERSYYGESLSQAADLIPGFAADAVFPLPQGELWRSVARDCSLMVLYYRNGWYGKALEAGERLIKPCPQDIFVRYFVACSQEMLNRPQKAKNSFLQLIQIHPGLAEGFLGLGRTASQTGALEAAEAALGKALRLDPDSAKAYVCRGDLQVRRGETQAATASYRRALSLDPLINAAYPRLSRLLAEKADTLLEAADLAQKARESMPSDPLALDAVGWITILEGKTEEGLAGIEAAHAGRPDDPIILYHMGSAQFLLGAFGKARHSLQQAFALSADFSGADRAREILDELSP
jgi:tetratricopeptide (TPR) repeat protein